MAALGEAVRLRSPPETVITGVGTNPYYRVIVNGGDTHEHATHQPRGTPPQPGLQSGRGGRAAGEDDCIGRQNGVDADGSLSGRRRGSGPPAFRNLTTILESEGASLANIVHWRIATVEGHSFDEGVAAFQQVWNPADPPPAITVHVVAGLAPGFLVEIDAVAVCEPPARRRPRRSGPTP